MAKSKKYAFGLYVVVALVIGALYYVSKRAYEGFQDKKGNKEYNETVKHLKRSIADAQKQMTNISTMTNKLIDMHKSEMGQNKSGAVLTNSTMSTPTQPPPDAPQAPPTTSTDTSTTMQS